MAPTGSRSDPYGRHRFTVEIDGIVTTGFAEVRGLSLTVDDPDDAAKDAATVPAWRRVIEHAVPSTHALGGGRQAEPDSANRSTLTLRRGVSDETALWEWCRNWNDRTGETRTVRVVLLDSQGTKVRGWECTGAQPVSWRGPTLTAASPGVAMETYELSYRDIRALDG